MGEIGGGEWVHGERRIYKFSYRHFGVAVANWCSYKAPRPVEETFMEQWEQFQVMAPQLVLSRGTILLTVTSQA